MDEELMNALKRIKEICEQDTCNICPFGSKTPKCMLKHHSPKDWEFNEPDEIFRYFK